MDETHLIFTNENSLQRNFILFSDTFIKLQIKKTNFFV